MILNLNAKDVVMKRFDIQVNFTVEAHSEASAEQKVWEFVQKNHHEFLSWDIVDWDFLEMIPEDGKYEVPPESVG